MSEKIEPNNFDLTKIRFTASEPRISSYISATKDCNNLKEAIQIYQYNIQLCESLYSSLHTFEITLRNKLDQSLIYKYGKMWHSDESLLLLNEQERKQVEKAIDEYKKHDKYKKLKLIENHKLLIITPITELNLGFWTNLLTKKQYEQSVFVKCISDVFPFAKNTDRNTRNIRENLEIVRKLRNRVFHYEPIWRNNYNIHQKYQTIYCLMGWMCPETSNWMRHYDNFKKIYDKEYSNFT